MEQRAIKFPEFKPQSDNWDSYMDRLKFCFEANGIISDSDERANFFTICGTQVFETLLALITPRRGLIASDVKYSEVETFLSAHYNPKANEISMLYKFYKRNQIQGETVSDYIAELRKISSGCNFSDLERILRDRLVCGMIEDRLPFEHLKKNNLRYQDVVDAVLASESAGKDLHMIRKGVLPSEMDMKSTDTPEPMDINAMQAKNIIRFCYRCGDCHPGECHFINAVCHFCNKIW